MATGVGELDRVLGGGLVPGSVVLLGGPPGIGKSTLLLQAAGALRRNGTRVLYASTEESAAQVRLRAERLGGPVADVLFLAATDLESILWEAEASRPDVLCIDSIQMVSSGENTSAVGSVTQVRECTWRLQEFAKQMGPAILLVGHVTKGGVLAGPRLLEHVVDVVLYFDGQRSHGHRLLRASKNRFGSADEIAAFRMTDHGLQAVQDPSALFLADRGDPTSGSALALPMQGTRALVAEVQALVAKARFAAPQRVASGIPPRRLALLVAVLERRAGLKLAEGDIFLNAIGGLKLVDPAADLAVVAAMAGADLDRVTPSRVGFIGEVGLGGEVRGVAFAEQRLRAATRSGLSGVVLPAVLLDAAATTGAAGAEEPSLANAGGSGLALHGVAHVRELVEWMDRACERPS